MSCDTDHLNELALDDEQFFERDYVERTRIGVKRNYRKLGCCLGMGFFVLVALPFGAVILLMTSLVGGAIGACIGSCVQCFIWKTQKRRAMHHDQKLLYLVRWAHFNFVTADCKETFIYLVVLRFHGTAVSVRGQPHVRPTHMVRRQMKQLYTFLKRYDVQTTLCNIVGKFKKEWRTHTCAQLTDFYVLCVVCSECYKMTKVYVPTAVEFMKRVLELPAAKKLFSAVGAINHDHCADVMKRVGDFETCRESSPVRKIVEVLKPELSHKNSLSLVAPDGIGKQYSITPSKPSFIGRLSPRRLPSANSNEILLHSSSLHSTHTHTHTHTHTRTHTHTQFRHHCWMTISM
eukprot:GHVR01174095.1.p1 GENE.GHVR01174095.1~~GHVR01174095.1.p1  ORF type:complete len:347 (+),score=89.01 GHVR01174095.1:51-1091(+)